MERNVFAELVKEYFRYLINDYGFSIVHESYYPEAMSNSSIRFQSTTSGVNIMSDRGDVIIHIGPSSDPPTLWLDLTTVIEFLMPEGPKQIYIFPDFPGEPEKGMSFQLRRLAPILREYCRPILAGEFFKWKELREFSRKQAEELTKQIKGKYHPSE